MPFLSDRKLCNCKSLFRKAIIFRTHTPHKYTIKPLNYPLTIPIKRVSRFTSGSMTAEASIAVPIFLFFMVNILSLILFFHSFSTNMRELHQQGRQLSMLAYTGGEAAGTVGDMIQLVKPERIKPPVPILGYRGTMIVSCCYMRAWTGYDVANAEEAGSDEEAYVYLTDNGSVYHTSRNCTHLSLSVQLAEKSEVVNLRNEAGGKYYPCEKCGGDGSASVYVAKEGDRYHNTVSCSGLKRTVRCVAFSETGELSACSRCGGR